MLNADCCGLNVDDVEVLVVAVVVARFLMRPNFSASLRFLLLFPAVTVVMVVTVTVEVVVVKAVMSTFVVALEVIVLV